MKWYNKDRTKFLDLSRVSYWHYSAKIPGTGFKTMTDLDDGHPSRLLVVTDGYEKRFENDEADEIYLILSSEKELL